MSFGTFSARSPAAKNVRHKPEAHTNAYSPLSNTDWIVRKKLYKNSRGNLRTVKTYTVILVYRRNLVTLKVYFVHTVIN